MRKYLILLPILSISFLIAQDEEEDINMDDLWDTTVWEEIEEINEVEGEVQQVVSVAGVRGAEAEDEALEHLYYRKSMKRLSQSELQNALGKLMKKRDLVKDEATLKKIDSYITQLKYKLRTY